MFKIKKVSILLVILFAVLTLAGCKKSFTITFVTNGGSPVSQVVLDSTSTIADEPTTTKSGYTFAGWYSDSALTEKYDFSKQVTKNLTLYAKWLIQYSVSFNSEGGSSIAAVFVTSGTPITKPDDPVKTGYTFAGWDSDNTLHTKYDLNAPVTGNLTLYADWTINQYTVTFDTDGGSAVAPVPVDYNTAVSLPVNPTKTGYTFSGWYTDNSLQTKYDFSTPVTGDLTVYAGWTPNIYPVSFNTGNGSTIMYESVAYNSTVARPVDPINQGYTFAGWYTDDTYKTPFDFSSPITGNTTVYAKWTMNQYTVTFDSNGGSDVAAQTVNYNLRVTKPADPAKAGYNFAGWYMDSGLTLPYNYSTQVTGDFTLYAAWTPDFQ